MIDLRVNKRAFLVDWVPIAKRCVLDPECCSNPIVVECHGKKFTLPGNAFLTVTGLTATCALGQFVSHVIASPFVNTGTSTAENRSYELHVDPVATLPDVAFYRPTVIANPFFSTGLGELVGSGTAFFDGLFVETAGGNSFQLGVSNNVDGIQDYEIYAQPSCVIRCREFTAGLEVIMSVNGLLYFPHLHFTAIPTNYGPARATPFYGIPKPACSLPNDIVAVVDFTPTMHAIGNLGPGCVCGDIEMELTA